VDFVLVLFCELSFVRVIWKLLVGFRRQSLCRGLDIVWQRRSGK